jgi:hypothetical protein
MQAASLAKGVKSWTQVEMIGIAQDNLSLYLLTQFREMHTLYATTSTYGHKDWRLYLSVIGSDDAGPGAAVWVSML